MQKSSEVIKFTYNLCNNVCIDLQFRETFSMPAQNPSNIQIVPLRQNTSQKLLLCLWNANNDYFTHSNTIFLQPLNNLCRGVIMKCLPMRQSRSCGSKIYPTFLILCLNSLLNGKPNFLLTNRYPSLLLTQFDERQYKHMYYLVY